MHDRAVFHKSTGQFAMNNHQSHYRQSTPYHRLRQILLGGVAGLLLAGAMTSCDRTDAPVSTHEAGGSQADRVAAISKLLSKTAPLPSPILDGHFVEEKTGDGRLGPSDFKAFYALTVAPADLPAWKAALAKSKPANTFSNDGEIKRATPKKAQPWWVNAADLEKLEFFSPHSITGNANGWAGINPDGRIFVYVFTM
jgi:hypothetical protein